MIMNSIDLFYEEKENTMKTAPNPTLVVIAATYDPDGFIMESIYETDVTMKDADITDPVVIDEIEEILEVTMDENPDDFEFHFPAIYDEELDRYQILIKRLDKNEYVIGYEC